MHESEQLSIPNLKMKSQIKRPPMSYMDAGIDINGGNHNNVVSVNVFDCRWMYKIHIALDLC
ncbi:unnamed protein product [Trifolium pratense]|uniref:Uncharacterized protein n=1 Tax=Trifolium pratense TaxID=57577 RepID=A0ACB0JB21_TRIPR|nr:unnamed protein product [Trifolium pratense]